MDHIEEDYVLAVVSAAQKKLEKSQKPLSEIELVRGIVHILKKNLGKDDNRHTSKIRFKKTVFGEVTKSDYWKDSVTMNSENKFVLSKDYTLVEIEGLENEFSYQGRNYEEAVSYTLRLLKKINEFKLEELCKEILKKLYNYDFEVTKKSGDMGVDVVGTRPDRNNPGKEEKMYIQVKRYSKTVGREYADKFIGAVGTFMVNNPKQFSKIDALFISTGTYPDSFKKQLEDNSKTGLCFEAWDGKQLSEHLIKSGMGVKYSVDLDFWEKMDPTLVPKIKK